MVDIPMELNRRLTRGCGKLDEADTSHRGEYRWRVGTVQLQALYLSFPNIAQTYQGLMQDSDA